MRQLLYIIFALTFIGCVDNKQQTDNINLADTIKADKEPLNESKTVEAVQSEYRILQLTKAEATLPWLYF